MAHIPYGYKIVDGIAVIDEEAQKKLTTLFRCFVSKKSYVRCHDISGVECSTKTCKFLLQDRTYLGTDFYPQIIDDALFTRAQRELAERSYQRQTRPKKAHVPVQSQFWLEDGDGMARLTLFELQLLRATNVAVEPAEMTAATSRLYDAITPVRGDCR